MDLMALHIAYRGEHPIFYYGQDYMGAFEAYLGAAFFRLLGPSVFTLRLSLIFLFTLFLFGMYFLTRLLYDRRVALFTSALLAVGSNDILTHQLIAIGGYPEILCFGAVIFLLVSSLALTSLSAASSSSWRERGRRVLLYALLGLMIGLALWSDLLILPCIAAAGLLLLCFCWRELLRWEGLALAVGSLLGALPLLIYNLHPVPGYNSWQVLLQLHSIGASAVAALHITPWQRLVNFVQISLPIITGANPCHWLADFTQHAVTQASSVCSVTQGLWGSGVLLLWASAVLLALSALWSLWQHIRGSQERTWSVEQRQHVIRQAARLMLLVSALLTVLQFVTSNAAALYPLTSSRYLLCLLLALPALLFPLFRLHRSKEQDSSQEDGHQPKTVSMGHRLRNAFAPALALALLALLATTFLIGTLGTLSEIPGVNVTHTQQVQLDALLLRLGITRIYSEYWTCNRMIFQTRERIICASLNDTLGQGFDRYLPYRKIVRATPHPAYVFPQSSPQAQYFALTHSHDPHYRRLLYVGYVIYQYIS